jgi:uncharacterized protein
MNDETNLATIGHWNWERTWEAGFVLHESILYFGDWASVSADGVGSHRSNTQCNAFEFSFRGPTVRWIGSTSNDQGCADVYLDGEYQLKVDSFSPTTERNVVKYERTGLRGDRIHTLRVVVRKDRNSAAVDCYQDVTSVQAVIPVSYPSEIARAMETEYARIEAGTKEYLPSHSWNPVGDVARAPENGVTLKPGVFQVALDRHIDYLNRCFTSTTYCDGDGWSGWLPASNDGRMLAGAASLLRWGEREDMRCIVDAIIANIEEHTRVDGYSNYYEESDSYELTSGLNSERKNYDRVFWTRGLLAAGRVGNASAYGLLRGMYDWFNSSSYLGRMLHGGNATNGLPGGPLVYLSPVGKDEDLVVTQRYYDQDYWMVELANREPLCLSHYPGERPHCYDLLGLEAFVDEYRATGAAKYLDAVKGGWAIYRDNYRHIGGATAIMEGLEVFPPKSYYIAERRVGETCGSVFWIQINSRLLNLYPDQEQYAEEIEESIYNVILANQDQDGNIRYYSNLQGTKQQAGCMNTCCEVSSSGLIGSLPELIYSIADDGLNVNLFAPSDITWSHGGHAVTLTTTTDFPFDPYVSINLSTPAPTQMKIRIRVPAWATGPMAIKVNGTDYGVGIPGRFTVLDREWSDNDRIEFSLPIGFRTEKYTGLEQIGDYDRYALMYGPMLMALVGELEGPGGVPHLSVKPEELPDALRPTEGKQLEWSIEGFPDYHYAPYWRIESETFTCFPVV